MLKDDAPEELEDSDALPSLLTFIKKDPAPGRSSVVPSHSSGGFAKRGSKRANALVENVTSKRAAVATAHHSQKISSRTLVASSRSLSLPGYQRNLFSRNEEELVHDDDLSSNRSAGIVSDSGNRRRNLTTNRTSDESGGDGQKLSRIDRFRQFAQKKKKSNGPSISSSMNCAASGPECNQVSSNIFSEPYTINEHRAICDDDTQGGYSNSSTVHFDESNISENNFSCATYASNHSKRSRESKACSQPSDQACKSLFSQVKENCSLSNSGHTSISAEKKSPNLENEEVLNGEYQAESSDFNKSDNSHYHNSSVSISAPRVENLGKKAPQLTEQIAQPCNVATGLQLPPSQRSEVGAGMVNDDPPNAMCYALDGRVTSLAMSYDGCFIVVGFTSGVIKVYELNMKKGLASQISACNTDLEDRYGHQLGSLATSSLSGTYRVHIEMGIARPSSNEAVFSPHVFAGARLGSTKFVVADLLSLQRLRRKRGFITLAGGGVKTFVHSDVRLRGFSSLSTVSYEVLTPSEAHACNNAAINSGYRAVYRLLCGGGYGNYTLWEVSLTALPVETNAEGAEPTFNYSQSWEVIQSGSVNAPSMTNGLVFNNNCESKRSEFIVQGRCKDARIHGVDKDTDTSPSNTALVHSKGQTLQGLTNLHAASSDGKVIFTGNSELTIFRMRSTSSNQDGECASSALLSIWQIDTFLLGELLGAGDKTNGPSRRGSRHLRQIEELHCTADGQFAIFRCSDNTIVLYSVEDVLSCGLPPSQSKLTNMSGTSNLNKPGVITLLFQAEEDYYLKVNISCCVISPPDDSESTSAQDNSVSMSDVIILLSWWPRNAQQNKFTNAVLKADRLKNFSGASSTIMPLALNLAVPGVGIVSHAHRRQLSKEESANNLCWLCKCSCLNARHHWPDIDESDTDTDEGSESVAESERHNTSSKSTVKENDVLNNDILSETLQSNQLNSPVPEKKKRSKSKAVSQRNSSSCSAECAQTIRGLQKKLVSAEAELVASKYHAKEKEKECRILVRKFDKRFAIEKQSRREWINEKSLLEGKVSDLLKKNAILEARCVELVQAQTRAIAGMQQIFGQSDGAGGNFTSSSAEDLQRTDMPFCVVCQAYTANIMILECGHICLCNDHALLMQSNNQLTHCPLCKKVCTHYRRTDDINN